MTLSLRQHCDQRLMGLDRDRASWWQHWRELAEYVLPRRYQWLITPNEASRGSPINGRIIDSTGTIAARTLSAGMMAGITSPTRPWFKLKIEGVDQDETSPINIWLAECERRMMRVMQESNFYNSMAVLWSDLAVFGTAAMLIYEDFEDVIRCYNPCAGEYYLANSPRMKVDVFYRKFVLSVAQLIQEFGIENVQESTRRQYETGGSSLQNEVVVAHSIEPNDPKYPEIPDSFIYRECYWEWGSSQGNSTNKPPFLRCRGYNELPGLFPRWDVVSNDPYGRGPAMDALGDIKQLQQETKRKAQAIDKMVNPPLLADVQLKNQPASTLPGGVTYVSGLNKTEGMRPIYQVMPPIQEIMQDIQEVQIRIKNIFFNDLFMMFQQMEAEPRSAAAVDARREEKMIMIGPVLERSQNEALDPGIDRIFNVMNRAKLFPPPPPEIQGRHIQVVYQSMLAEAQKAVATASIERLWQVGGNLAAARPDVLDNLDFDEGLRIYSDQLSADPRLIKPMDRVMAERQERAKQQQQAALLQATAPAAQAAKNLSETEVGGGKNALESMLQ